MRAFPKLRSCAAIVFAALIATGIAVAQTASTVPRFEDYRVTESFSGTPHLPIFATDEQRHYRTRIREGVEKGWGVWINGEWSKEQNRPGPNFAGHDVVIVWGCGTGCLRMALCDAQRGAVYDRRFQPTLVDWPCRC